MNGADNKNNSGNNGAAVGTQASPLPSLPNFQLPQPVGQPQYDPTTGAFSYLFNFTNPLATELTFSQLSAQVVTEDGTQIGNVSIPQTISIAPGANSIITAIGQLNPDMVNRLTAQYQSGTLNIALDNVNVDVGGVYVNIPHIDAGSISSLESSALSSGGT